MWPCRSSWLGSKIAKSLVIIFINEYRNWFFMQICWFYMQQKKCSESRGYADYYFLDDYSAYVLNSGKNVSKRESRRKYRWQCGLFLTVRRAIMQAIWSRLLPYERCTLLRKLLNHEVECKFQLCVLVRPPTAVCNFQFCRFWHLGSRSRNRQSMNYVEEKEDRRRNVDVSGFHAWWESRLFSGYT